MAGQLRTLRIALGGKMLASNEVTNAFDDNTPTPM
jgi:hypothetical protein